MTDLIKTEYMIISPEDSHWERVKRDIVEWPREPGYDEIEKVVKPLVMGDFEQVSVLFSRMGGPEAPADMFVNDIGALSGKFPINPLGTWVYHTFSRLKQPKAWLGAPPIFGPAVLFMRRVWY